MEKRAKPDIEEPRSATSVRHLLPPSQPAGSAATVGEMEEEDLDDIGAGDTHDEGYHRMRCSMRVAEQREPHPRCSGFSARGLEKVHECLQSGERHFLNLRIFGHLLEDVGVHESATEERADETRATKEEGEDANFMQTTGATRRRTPIKERSCRQQRATRAFILWKGGSYWRKS